MSSQHRAIDNEHRPLAHTLGRLNTLTTPDEAHATQVQTISSIWQQLRRNFDAATVDETRGQSFPAFALLHVDRVILAAALDTDDRLADDLERIASSDCGHRLNALAQRWRVSRSILLFLFGFEAVNCRVAVDALNRLRHEVPDLDIVQLHARFQQVPPTKTLRRGRTAPRSGKERLKEAIEEISPTAWVIPASSKKSKGAVALPATEMARASSLPTRRTASDAGSSKGTRAATVDAHNGADNNRNNDTAPRGHPLQPLEKLPTPPLTGSPFSAWTKENDFGGSGSDGDASDLDAHDEVPGPITARPPPQPPAQDPVSEGLSTIMEVSEDASVISAQTNNTPPPAEGEEVFPLPPSVSVRGRSLSPRLAEVHHARKRSSRTLANNNDDTKESDFGDDSFLFKRRRPNSAKETDSEDEVECGRLGQPGTAEDPFNHSLLHNSPNRSRTSSSEFEIVLGDKTNGSSVGNSSANGPTQVEPGGDKRPNKCKELARGGHRHEAAEQKDSKAQSPDAPDLPEVPQLSLECLGTAWLKDDVVQASVRLVATSSPEPIAVVEPLVAADVTSNRPRRSVLRDLSGASTIVLPLFTGNHWMLAVARDEGARRFEAEVYDSIQSTAHLQRARQCLDVFQRLYFPASESDPAYLTGMSCPQQTNGNDCGVFTVAFQVYLVAGYPMPRELDSSLWRLVVCIMNRLYTCAAAVSSSSPATIVEELKVLFRERFINCERLSIPPVPPEVLPPPAYNFSTSSAYRMEDTVRHTDRILRWQREVSEFVRQRARERAPVWGEMLQHVVRTRKLFAKVRDHSAVASARLAAEHQQRKCEVGRYARAAEAGDGRVRDDEAQASRRLRRVEEQEQRLQSAMVAWDLLVDVLGEAERTLRERLAVASGTE